MSLISAIVSAALIAASLSIDSFAAAFAYGCKKIRISMLSLNIINLICTGMLGLSFFFGALLLNYIPEQVALILSFTILFIIGLTKLFDSITKSIIRKHTNLSKEINLSVFNFKLLLRLYADPEAADADVSKSISPGEAVVLAVSVSLDGIAVGFSAAMLGVNVWAIIIFSLITDFIALTLGGWLGNRIAHKLRFNISWIAGLILIGLAIEKLI
ncbi:MAG: sporulation membrane protein YtaF [Oscillospiraceae bacterium]|nr:sporulation membrane protein YtaF [Oscillospiraceae bacterium]